MFLKEISGLALAVAVSSQALAQVQPQWATKHGNLPDPVADSDFVEQDRGKVQLGQLLFFDKILSGNLNISCATCHHPFAFTSDGLSLGIGEGGLGFGVARDTGDADQAVHERVPRNAPALFNIGALEYSVMFHDGRVAIDGTQPSGFLSPAGDDLPLDLESVLAAQAMFPVTSATEMAGQAGENAQADAAAAGNLAGPDGVWEIIAQKVRSFPGYVIRFGNVFDDVESAEDITYAHIANAMAAFEDQFYRSYDSPFDRFLNGDDSAMSPAALAGMDLFYGEAGCSGCHSGKFQTNHEFAAIAMPQIGNGKGDNLPGYDDGLDDFGLERVTGNPADRFKFRVPALRNVALTAPYGHNGAYNTLRAVIRHHRDPVTSLMNYDPRQATLPSRDDLDSLDFQVMNDISRVAAIAEANELAPVDLNSQQVRELEAFLHALTDTEMLDLRRDVPTSVPSGLSIFD